MVVVRNKGKEGTVVRICKGYSILGGRGRKRGRGNSKGVDIGKYF